MASCAGRPFSRAFRILRQLRARVVCYDMQHHLPFAFSPGRARRVSAACRAEPLFPREISRSLAVYCDVPAPGGVGERSLTASPLFLPTLVVSLLSLLHLQPEIDQAAMVSDLTINGTPQPARSL
jgi:hypothetical protein